MFLLAVCALVSLSACGGPPPPAGGPAQPITLTVSAASDLTDAFNEIGAAYEQATGVQVTFNFGATGQLAQQIDKGAPIDVFAAAAISYIDDLEAKGRIVPGTKVLLAQGRLTIWTRQDGPLTVEKLEDLLDSRVRHVAIANPDHAPYGAAAKQALQAAGVWPQIQDKLVIGENVSQALQYAETGNVDVAIAPLSLSRRGNGRWTLVPAEMHKPLNQALAVVAGTQYEKEARHFVEYVNGPEGRPIMHKYGFLLPGEDGAP